MSYIVERSFFYFILLVTTMIPHGAVRNRGGYEHKRYSTSRLISLILGRHLFSTVCCDSALDLQEPQGADRGQGD